MRSVIIFQVRFAKLSLAIKHIILICSKKIIGFCLQSCIAVLGGGLKTMPIGNFNIVDNYQFLKFNLFRMSNEKYDF